MLIDIIWLVVSSYAQSIYGLFYVLLIMYLYSYVKQQSYLEQYWLGLTRDTIINNLLYLVLYGMIVGLFASFVIVILGIAVDKNAILLIWFLALLLMFFNHRFLCFSYAGSIIALISLIFGVPKMQVSSVIALIGFLHIMESLLVIIDGKRASLPVFMEHKHFKPVGAFVIDKLWPIPLVMLMAPQGAASVATGGGIPMPSWWPIFGAGDIDANYFLFPIAIVLGYRDIVITERVNKRTSTWAISFAAYGALVMIMAYIATKVHWFNYVAVVLTLGLHEAIMIYGRREQNEGKPLFGAPWRGIRILDVFAHSPASLMGIQSGDILVKVNGNDVNSIKMLSEVLKDSPTFIWVEVIRNRKNVILEYKDYYNGVNSLGLITVPRQTSRFFKASSRRSILSWYTRRKTFYHDK